MNREFRVESPPRVLSMTHAGSAHLAQSFASSLPARLLFIVFVVFNFPAFTLQLALNMDTGNWVGSPVLQAATFGTEIFALAIIVSSRKMIIFVLRCWPIWILILAAFISAAWSYNPKATIHAANTYMTSALLGLAIVGALPKFQCIRFTAKLMVLGCVLSIAWVLFFPAAGIHQLTDPFQTVHAGLWRGVFSHKQGLGVFAGVTVGILLFYRTTIFSLPLFVFSLGCSAACLIGTKSATGFIMAAITPAFLYAGYFVTRFPLAARKAIFLQVALGVASVCIFYKVGLFDFVIVHILDKSTDLSGREDAWPIIIANFHSSGADILGVVFGVNVGGYLSEFSVDNGYIDKLLEFGYASSPIIYATFIAILWGGIRLLLTSASTNAMINVFPFGIWSAILVLNITESNFMTKCQSTLLTSIAVGLIAQQRVVPPRRKWQHELSQKSSG